MAWKSSGVWNKPIDKPQKNEDDSSFPGLKPKGPEAAPKLEYEELQQNELIALEAIYGEDFMRHAETPGAWKVLNTTPSSCPQYNKFSLNRA